jgi:uncharacterized membrane protein (UPF0127 family)
MGSCRSQLILALAAGLFASAASADCPPDVVELRNLAGTVQRFHIELADEPGEQAQGLMFREKMATASGMLFVFPAPKHAAFWMKNTLIPLDMIFINAAGQVTKVHENAIPQDETVIDGGDAVRFVLEINGGLAKPMGIAPGAVMRHPLVGDAAIWGCDAP